MGQAGVDGLILWAVGDVHLQERHPFTSLGGKLTLLKQLSPEQGLSLVTHVSCLNVPQVTPPTPQLQHLRTYVGHLIVP